MGLGGGLSLAAIQQLTRDRLDLALVSQSGVSKIGRDGTVVDAVPALATVADSQGRSVVLTAERWAHIVDGHPELARHQLNVLNTISAPAREGAGRRPGEAWFYRENAGPSRWLKVVVLYGPTGGFIVTAFPRRRLP